MYLFFVDILKAADEKSRIRIWIRNLVVRILESGAGSLSRIHNNFLHMRIVRIVLICIRIHLC